MTERGIGVLACRPNTEEGDLLRKDLSFQVAKFTGFDWVRFNPDVNYLGGDGPGATVDPDRWEFLDWHVDRCRRNGHRIDAANLWRADRTYTNSAVSWASYDFSKVVFDNDGSAPPVVSGMTGPPADDGTFVAYHRIDLGFYGRFIA